MSIRIHNALWNLKVFWRRHIKRTYVDLGAMHPFLFKISEVIDG